jgi:hypothetical protein
VKEERPCADWFFCSLRRSPLPRPTRAKWPSKATIASTIYYVEIAPNEYAGIKRTDNGDAMFDRMAIRSTYRGGSRGDLVMIDADGDEIFATWEGSVGELGAWHWVRGTGKYDGISGEGVWNCSHLLSPDGTGMAICPHKMSWKLP